MKIIYRKHNKKLFLQRWQEYLDHNLASYIYLPFYLDYMLYYSKDLCSDESFVAIENNKPVAICYLPIEKNRKYFTITSAEGYSPAPLVINKKIEKLVYSYIDTIARQKKVMIIKFYLDPLIIEHENKFNKLLQYGYIDSSSSDCLLDLTKNNNKLWQDIRKGHRSDIKKILKDKSFEILIMDQSNAQYNIHEAYRKIHYKCAGRATRVKKTFDQQFKMLDSDRALLICLKFKKTFIGFNYFYHYKKTAIYASGADDPDYNKLPLYHVMLWTAIKYYQKRDFEFLQLSSPCSYNLVNGFDDYSDQKQINIGHFKRGFGPKMVTLFRGIKYFSKDLFIKDADEFKNKTLESLKI